VRNAGGANGYGLYDDTSGRHYFAGKVGIGTSSFSTNSKLEVDIGTTAASAGWFRANNSNAALVGENTGAGVGVYGSNSGGGVAVYGTCGSSGRAIDGWATGTGWAVAGSHVSGGCYGVLGSAGTGVYANSNNTIRPAAWFVCPAGGVALQADGEVRVKQLVIQGGADLAERFETAEEAEPGTVMMIDAASPGRMRVSDAAYNHRVAGVVSGGEALAAGVILGDDGEAPKNTTPIALSGRVWVKCDAQQHPIHPGDLLTTSDLLGHAMAATDHSRAAGAVLGKAMSTLEAGTGMVLVLVSLQ
jgi:hypothetical protein